MNTKSLKPEINLFINQLIQKYNSKVYIEYIQKHNYIYLKINNYQIIFYNSYSKTKYKNDSKSITIIKYMNLTTITKKFINYKINKKNLISKKYTYFNFYTEIIYYRYSIYNSIELNYLYPGQIKANKKLIYLIYPINNYIYYKKYNNKYNNTFNINNYRIIL